MPYKKGTYQGPTHTSWKGGREVLNGKVRIWMPEHPRADKRGRVYEHIVTAEKAIGFPLPLKAVIFHIDDDGTNNVPSNFVICEGLGYALALRRRQRALKETGHANWLICGVCAKYDDPANMWVGVNHDGGVRALHRECNRKYGKPLRDRWQKSDAGKVSRKRYKQSELGVAAGKRWSSSEKGRASLLTGTHNRRARIEGNGGSHTTAEWLALLETYGYRCQKCGVVGPMTRDHIVALSKGGTNDISNIQPLCRPCNSRKGNKESP